MNTNTLQPIPYLMFDGKCAEALDFYAAVLGGAIIAKRTYGDIPMDLPLSDDAKQRIVNEMLELPGGAMLYGGDCRPDSTCGPMSGMMLTLNYPTVEQALDVFDKLSVGGQIVMPFAAAFWAEKFGMLIDKYGVEWAINGVLGALR